MTKKEMWVGIIIIFLMLGVTLFIMVKNYKKETLQQQTASSRTSGGGGGNTTSRPYVLPQVNEQSIKSLLNKMGVNELHNPPLSSNTPKIEMFVSKVYYTAEVKKKVIYVTKGECPSEDIRISTTNEEVIKMLQNKDYIKTSFEKGLSNLEMVESKTTLFMKGYLSLYNKITGEEAPA